MWSRTRRQRYTILPHSRSARRSPLGHAGLAAALSLVSLSPNPGRTPYPPWLNKQPVGRIWVVTGVPAFDSSVSPGPVPQYLPKQLFCLFFLFLVCFLVVYSGWITLGPVTPEPQSCQLLFLKGWITEVTLQTRGDYVSKLRTEKSNMQITLGETRPRQAAMTHSGPPLEMPLVILASRLSTFPRP